MIDLELPAAMAAPDPGPAPRPGGRAPRVVVLARAPAVRAGLRATLGAGGFDVLADVPSPGRSGDITPLDLVVIDTEGELLAPGSPGDLPALLLVPPGERPPRDAPLLAARGYLRADADDMRILAAARAVATGLAVIDPELGWDVVAGPGPPEAGPGDLTPREAEVLRLIAAGLSNRQVAAALGISEHTAKFHVGTVLSKLGATSRTEAAMIGARRGLVVL